MSKIRRNAPCPCGSRRKYKHCCGAIKRAASSPRSRAASGFPQRALLEIRRREAREHQRRLLQGLGRPIISCESHGYRLVAVGKEIRWSDRWKTFHDFLFDYIKDVLTPEWGNAELAKPQIERHPLVRWFIKSREYQQAIAAKPGELFSAPMTGAIRAYLGLAYDLYLCAHNAELPPLLLKRLRAAATFEGAVYEAYVVGLFARAGFSIEMEDEEDPTRTHCEFVATHKTTGRKFSVEAKAVTSLSRRAGLTAEPPRIRRQLYDALKKDVPYSRVIFVDLGRSHKFDEKGEPDWALDVERDIEAAERELTIRGEPAPPAYVFVTNRTFLLDLDGTEWSEIGVAYGLKIADFVPSRGFPSILEAARARDRHSEAHSLIKASLAHSGNIPSSFDDQLPEEVFNPSDNARLRIGDTYLVPNGAGREVPGVLTEAFVMAAEKCVRGVYQLLDGRLIICTVPITDQEVAVYNRSPETFFGVVRYVPKGIKTPLETYDFVFESCSKTPREKLLEFMSGWPEIERFRTLRHRELAQEYAAAVATSMWAKHGKSQS